MIKLSRKIKPRQTKSPADKKTSPVNEQSNLDSKSPQSDITAPGDVVVPFDKINELAEKRKAAGQEAAQPDIRAAEQQPPEAPKRRGRPPNPDKAAQTDKPKAAPKATKEKSGTGGSKKTTGEDKPKPTTLLNWWNATPILQNSHKPCYTNL